MKLAKKSIVVSREMIGQAIDRALLTAGVELSRRKIRQILDSGGVTINQRVERFASYKVQRGDKIFLAYSPETFVRTDKLQFSLGPADILYDQHELLAINKPPLLSSQASRSPAVPYVVSVVGDYLRKIGSNDKLVLCHRLDKETSGVLMLARNEAAGTRLMAQFKSRKVAKMYLALCYGLPAKDEWEVSCYLSTLHPKTGLVHKVNAGGNFSHTAFKTLAVNPSLKLSLLACYPTTGRTHQIRAHLLLSQLPIIGDKKYSLPKPRALTPRLQELSLSHHFLHAQQLSFYPQGEGGAKVTVSAPLPLGMQEFCRESKLAP